MDLAKMLAITKLIAPLAGPDFRIWRQTRTGLLSYPVDIDAARAHLAASIYLQMALRPHIVHVVSYTEADHAATAADVIESCKIARRAIDNALGGPDMTQDERIQDRVVELIHEAAATLEVIRGLAPKTIADPLADADTLTRAVQTGILDAPQLRNNPYARGQIVSRIDSRGACIVIDPNTGEPLSEFDRITTLKSNHRRQE
jgi:hypothetical protein